jgi:hypothetical protein
MSAISWKVLAYAPGYILSPPPGAQELSPPPGALERKRVGPVRLQACFGASRSTGSPAASRNAASVYLTTIVPRHCAWKSVLSIG